jgi:hypothetical protein
MKKRINYNVLELRSRSQFVPAKGYERKIELVKIKKSGAYNYEVPLSESLRQGWWEDLALNKDILRSYLAYPEVHFFVAIYNDEVIGSLDLIILPDREVEIKNFGIASEELDFEVRALFLSKAVDYCFQFDPKRIFFHASEFEKMSAISNYLSQGFSITSQTHDTGAEEVLKEQSALLSSFLLNLN